MAGVAPLLCAEPVCYTVKLQLEGGNNSVVECDLAKVEVAGSNPVSRSNLRLGSAKAADRGFGWDAILGAACGTARPHA
jgi:hypothetical protein